MSNNYCTGCNLLLVRAYSIAGAYYCPQCLNLPQETEALWLVSLPLIDEEVELVNEALIEHRRKTNAL